jgi:ribosomal protein S2
MKIPNVTIQQLLEAGVHLGTQNFEMESKNEKIYFWKKRFNSYN